jgi:hypothetical protein
VSLAEVRVRHAVAVGEREAVEAALHDAVQLAGREVVAEEVATIVRRVQVAGAGLPVEADGVAEAARVYLLARAVGPIAHDRGATTIVLDAHVAARADRHVHESVGADPDRTRPVMARRDAGHHARKRAARRARRGSKRMRPTASVSAT